MTDIVERLREYGRLEVDFDIGVLQEAADEIERLRGENKEQQDKIFVLEKMVNHKPEQS